MEGKAEVLIIVSSDHEECNATAPKPLHLV